MPCFQATAAPFAHVDHANWTWDVGFLVILMVRQMAGLPRGSVDTIFMVVAVVLLTLRVHALVSLTSPQLIDDGLCSFRKG